ncbi:hypothetical protein K490DRAFT_68016 [Saccharata proteae CBS 121410]|uniref:ORC6 first cyclin-like domain-containing protein n=1 Tax=Saccharata proteae CBS 121410 TaxID=1314787 RepID=A0A9P4HTR2_9PEZI|nr:hypothetical protein K490DRAFT_68016 [Saccharata proteae CBS 121410]
MSRPVEQALTALIPSLNGPLPQELVNTATALVAQSRSRASTLKSEEEIARVYACAHLACERSKQSLNLPQIVPRPPIPPRLYKKVYSYLDGALAVGIPKTPTKRTRDDDAPASTPRRGTATSSAGTPLKTTPRRTATPKRNGAAVGDEEAPSWTMPTIRKVCKALEAAAAPPHVYAGVCSVLKAQNSNNTPTVGSRTRTRRGTTSSTSTSSDTISETQIPALAAAILFFVILRLTGQETTAEEQGERLEKAVNTLQGCEACQDQTPDEIEKAIDHFMTLAPPWLEMEWFQNIPAGSGLDINSSNHVAEEEDDGVEGSPTPRKPKSSNATTARKRAKVSDNDGSSILKGGVGTMMQAKLDYLSEERRQDYLDWKERILARIEQIEQGQVPEISAS